MRDSRQCPCMCPPAAFDAHESTELASSRVLTGPIRASSQMTALSMAELGPVAELEDSVVFERHADAEWS